MNLLHREIADWLGIAARLVDREIELAASMVHSLATASTFPGAECEVLSCVIFVLERERLDTVARRSELFARPLPSQLDPTIATIFSEVVARGRADEGLGLLWKSITTRISLAKEREAYFDGHTRLVLELQACAHQGITLPALRRMIDAMPSRGTALQDLRGAYERFMPTTLRHPDDFLGTLPCRDEGLDYTRFEGDDDAAFSASSGGSSSADRHKDNTEQHRVRE